MPQIGDFPHRIWLRNADLSRDMCRWILFLLAAGALWADETLVSTQVLSAPPGGEFTVDGQTYTGPATFFWPANSTHVLGLPNPPPAYPGAQYYFQYWQNSLGQKLLDGSTIAITASADIASYTAVWQVYYAITLVLDPTTAPWSCAAGPQWGKIYVNLPADGACYAAGETIWGQMNTTVIVELYVPPGLAFLKWLGAFSGSTAPALQFTLDGPKVLQPVFAIADAITLNTSPPNLQVTADGLTFFAPVTYYWAEGSQHTVGAPGAQRDQVGSLWAFGSWSDGGAQYHTYTVAAGGGALTLTATFVPGLPVEVISNPQGLKLTVDGSASTQATFTWGVGSQHTISAPVTQIDAAGRHYVFLSWTGGGAATQVITVAPQGNGWVANYQPLDSLTVGADPSSVTLTVDGAACPGSCTVYHAPGDQVAVIAPASLPLGAGTRVQFASWSDGVTALSRSIQVVSDRQTLGASYPYSYLLAASSDPANGSDFVLHPTSDDGFYAGGTAVSVTAQPRAGFRFHYWEGDLSGGLLSGSLTMNQPHSVCAVLDQVPYIAPAGVQNAAAPTPAPGVAPGSIVAIYGSSLAPAPTVGPASPLAQTLAGVTVLMTGRILPLYFVSPQQINAQLPSGLAAGAYSLTVHWEGHDDVQAAFQVVRDAPGLFTEASGGVQYALVTRPNGALATPSAPALPGETVTLYGTGFGPYLGSTPDGFAVPQKLNLPLADPVTILSGSLSLDPTFAGADPGAVGVALVSFRIPDDAVAPMELLATSNGVKSNSVVVPVGPAPETVNNSETGSQ
jgi:uncharacterized protein (TIGR03437 family)